MATWPLSSPSEQQRLERAFSNRGIPVAAPGFYDHPAFLAEERKHPQFLEQYARYVEVRAYDASYLATARQRVASVARALEAAVTSDGRLGACVDASGMLGRMLDRVGVWNYVAKASLTVTFPLGSGFEPRYFWSFDEGNFVAPHAIVVAPPFGIIDITVRQQPYDSGQRELLPPHVLATEFQLDKWTPEDLASADIRAALSLRGVRFDAFLHRQNPSMESVMKLLPARTVVVNGTSLKYVVVGVGATNEPLEGITGYKPGGRTALQIFEQDVMPRVAEL
jgi:hypothetical protein